jgi:hypothetical protein
MENNATAFVGCDNDNVRRFSMQSDKSGLQPVLVTTFQNDIASTLTWQILFP